MGLTDLVFVCFLLVCQLPFSDNMPFIEFDENCDECLPNYEPLWEHKPKHSGENDQMKFPSPKSFQFDFGGPPKPSHHPPPPKPWGKYFGIGGGVLVLMIIIGGFYWWRVGRYRRFGFRKRKQTNLAVISRGNHYLNSEDLKPSRPTDPWELRREDVIVHYDRKLGSGAFADVFVGEIIGDAGIRRVYNDVLSVANFHDCEVAVKMLPPFADENSRSDFQKEILFMKSLKYHPHLVCLMGYVPDSISPLLLIEYCSRGDLLHFVRERKDQIINGSENLKVKNLVSFAWQIANGLEYLTSIGCIHRDVAARNVLLDESNICKIGDFGLCRLADSLIYTTRGGRLPVRWMSPESLKSFEYSTKSDVWSYGVLLYELFSVGEVPYAGLENNQVLEFLEANNRLHKPAYCTEDIYELMRSCWAISPVDRLSFAEICLQLMRVLENANSDYGYVTAVEAENVEVIEEKPLHQIEQK
ncbi:Protein kinase domain-containing protein [Aphelenchoides besseyi]|nr:Protein kinase domain-containing protein [Aphelenchoides besseyi]